MLPKVLVNFIFISISFYTSSAEMKFDFKNVEKLTSASLEEFKQSPQVSIVYYYIKEINLLTAFLNELDKSAEHLLTYGTKTGVFDCSVHKEETTCSEPETESHVYTYQNGKELYTLNIDTLFDVNSVLSNILQLILMKEVPFIHTKQNRHEIEDESKGKKDIIYSYHNYIGTYEHRIFMELAFAYHDKYSFVITPTEDGIQELIDAEKVIKDEESSAVWVLFCKNTNPHGDSRCPNVMYRGKQDLKSLAVYLKSLTPPTLYFYPEDDAVPQCKQKMVSCLLLFLDSECKDKVLQMANHLKYYVYGSAETVIINTEHEHFDTKELLLDRDTPAVALTREGRFVYQNVAVTLPNVIEFIQENLFTVEKKESSSETETSSFQNFEFNYDEVEIQDDEVAESVHRMSMKKMPSDRVPFLNDKTFPTAVADSPLLMVLFYLPFDVRSTAFLYSYLEVAQILKESDPSTSPLGVVNCHDWTDVCQKQNITIYPTTRVFRKTADPMDYQGPLDTTAVVSLVKLLQLETPLKLQSEEDVENYSIGNLPINASEMFSNISVLGIFDKNSEKEMKVFNKVAENLKSSFLFAITKPEYAKCSTCPSEVPSVAVFRHTDPIKPVVTLTKDFTEKNIETFVKQARLPVLPELTIDVFPLLYRQQKPFVILFCNPRLMEVTANVMILLSQIIKSGAFPNIIFAWMDSTSATGKVILDLYNKNSAEPALSFVNLQQGKVYNIPEGEITREKVQQWLQSVLDGKRTPCKMLKNNEWKPLRKGYDYLLMQDYQEKYGHESLYEKMTPEPEYSEDEKEIDDEIREELAELRKSRLYNMQREHKMKTKDDKPDSHVHTEL